MYALSTHESPNLHSHYPHMYPLCLHIHYPQMYPLVCIPIRYPQMYPLVCISTIHTCFPFICISTINTRIHLSMYPLLTNVSTYLHIHYPHMYPLVCISIIHTCIRLSTFLLSIHVSTNQQGWEFAHLLISLKSNERLWTIRSDHSRQMSNCDKWYMSEWAICSKNFG